MDPKEAFEQATGEKLSAPEAAEEPQESPRVFLNPEPEEPAVEEQPESEEVEAPKEQPANSGNKDYRNKLLLAGMSKKAVGALDDDEVLEQWSRVEERERSVAQAKEENARLRKQLEGQATDKGEQPEPTPALDLSKSLKPLLTELGVEDGSEAASALTKTLEALTGPLQQQVESLKSELTAQRESSVSEKIQSQRDRLLDSTPQLKGDGAWTAVLSVAEALAQKGEHSTMEAVFDAAREEVYGPIEDIPDTRQAQKNGARVAVPKKQKQERKMSTDDKNRALFKAIEKGASREEARVLSSKLGLR